MSRLLRISLLFFPLAICQITIMRLVWLHRYQSLSALLGMIIMSGFVSLVGPYFALRPNLSDEIVDQFFPRIRDMISFPPGRLLTYFLNGLNYVAAICFFCRCSGRMQRYDGDVESIKASANTTRKRFGVLMNLRKRKILKILIMIGLAIIGVLVLLVGVVLICIKMGIISDEFSDIARAKCIPAVIDRA